MNKIEYRKRLPPESRKLKAEYAIREALKSRKKTFSELLDETDLSRPTLASHLKKMHKEGAVRREKDSKDYRVTYYSLTNKGRDEFHRQEDIKTLTVGSSHLVVRRVDGRLSISGPPELLPRELGVEANQFLQPSIRHDWMDEEDAKTLRECMTYSVYSSKRLRNVDKNYVKVLAELAAASVLNSFALQTRGRAIHRFEKIPNLTFLFRLDSDKFREFLRNRKATISTQSQSGKEKSEQNA